MGTWRCVEATASAGSTFMMSEAGVKKRFAILAEEFMATELTLKALRGTRGGCICFGGVRCQYSPQRGSIVVIF